MDISFFFNILGLGNLSYYEVLWVLFGTFGQLVFFSRWLVQWYYVEKVKTSIIPLNFWWLSLVGGFITLLYAYHIRSFPFIIAQAIGIIIYSRNIYLLLNKNNDQNP